MSIARDKPDALLPTMGGQTALNTALALADEGMNLVIADIERDTAQAVAEVLRGYVNPDGGFGSALEPDLRTSESQPIFVEVGLQALA